VSYMAGHKCPRNKKVATLQVRLYSLTWRERANDEGVCWPASITQEATEVSEKSGGGNQEKCLRGGYLVSVIGRGRTAAGPQGFDSSCLPFSADRVFYGSAEEAN